ncbi:MAG: hypothetical protein LBC39_06400 [Methanobrevibacter sp.]|nr:hypothetical protein [Candidatus Methanovirga aequatorialis]
MKNLKLDNIIGISLFILSLILLSTMLTLVGLNPSIWFDEAYTFNIMTMSLKNMLITTARDVHPPLYYLILQTIFKFLSLFPSTLNIHDTINAPIQHEIYIYIGKLVSLVPLICLIIFSFKNLRKEFGWLTTGIFAFCVVTMPKMMLYSVQVRMYSWTVLFLTLSLYYAYMIIKEPNKNKNWVIFALFSLMAAYTHYYTTIATAIIYLLLVTYIIKENRILLKKWILTTTITALFYLPWVLVFISQSEYVKSSSYGWWIQPTSQDIIDTISSICSPMNIIDKYALNSVAIVLFICLVISFVSYIILIYYKKTERKNIILSLGGVIVLIATMSFATIFSYTVKPMFYSRYTVVCLGCLWLSFSVVLSKIHSKKIIFAPILIIIIFTGMINTISFINDQNQLKTSYSDFKEYANKINENDTIITIGSDYLIKFYLKKNHIIKWNNSNSSITSEIKKAIKNNKIWIFNMGQEIYDFNETMITKGYELEEVKKISPMSNSYPYEIYLLNKKNNNL